MDKWRCIPCDYIYDPALGDEEGGIGTGTAFENLPHDWECPIYGEGETCVQSAFQQRYGPDAKTSDYAYTLVEDQKEVWEEAM